MPDGGAASMKGQEGKREAQVGGRQVLPCQTIRQETLCQQTGARQGSGLNRLPARRGLVQHGMSKAGVALGHISPGWIRNEGLL